VRNGWFEKNQFLAKENRDISPRILNSLNEKENKGYGQAGSNPNYIEKSGGGPSGLTSSSIKVARDGKKIGKARHGGDAAEN